MLRFPSAGRLQGPAQPFGCWAKKGIERWGWGWSTIAGPVVFQENRSWRPMIGWRMSKLLARQLTLPCVTLLPSRPLSCHSTKNVLLNVQAKSGNITYTSGQKLSN